LKLFSALIFLLFLFSHPISSYAFLTVICFVFQGIPIILFYVGSLVFLSSPLFLFYFLPSTLRTILSCTLFVFIFCARSPFLFLSSAPFLLRHVCRFVPTRTPRHGSPISL
jgi:hypothetical protein